MLVEMQTFVRWGELIGCVCDGWLMFLSQCWPAGSAGCLGWLCCCLVTTVVTVLLWPEHNTTQSYWNVGFRCNILRWEEQEDCLWRLVVVDPPRQSPTPWPTTSWTPPESQHSSSPSSSLSTDPFAPSQWRRKGRVKMEKRKRRKKTATWRHWTVYRPCVFLSALLSLCW